MCDSFIIFSLQDFNLSNHERPLGLCTLSNSKDLLLLTGEQSRAADITFLPSSRSSEYQLKLRKVKLKYGESRAQFHKAIQR